MMNSDYFFRIGKLLLDITGTKPTEKDERQFIRFQGQKFVLVEGAIAYEEDYEEFRPSYAHLFEDGNIKRFGKIIGTKADIEFINRDSKCSK